MLVILIDHSKIYMNDDEFEIKDTVIVGVDKDNRNGLVIPLSSILLINTLEKHPEEH